MDRPCAPREPGSIPTVRGYTEHLDALGNVAQVLPTERFEAIRHTFGDLA